MVRGNDAPAIANCELLLAADEMVTLPPVALKVDDCVVEFPTSTLPKFTVVGDAVSFPIAVPVPLMGMFRLMGVMKRLPPLEPTDCGAKVIVSVTLFPGARTTGRVGPVTEKLVPVD